MTLTLWPTTSCSSRAIRARSSATAASLAPPLALEPLGSFLRGRCPLELPAESEVRTASDGADDQDDAEKVAPALGRVVERHDASRGDGDRVSPSRPGAGLPSIRTGNAAASTARNVPERARDETAVGTNDYDRANREERGRRAEG
jgi:hypothetical protein